MSEVGPVPSTTESPPKAHRSAAGQLLTYAPIAFCLLLATALRLHDIGRDSLWGDEGLSVTIARLPLMEVIPRDIEWEQIPPVHHLL